MEIEKLAQCVSCGVASFVYCHMQPPKTLSSLAVVSLVPPLILTYKNYRNESPFALFLAVLLVYLTTLFASIATYRLSPFHPLAAFPGPMLARVTRFWAFTQFIGGRQHLVSHQLFDYYGSVVRSGPNHLLFRDARAISTILGARDPWPKHLNAIVGLPKGATPSLQAQMDPAEHSKRRRLWDTAFTPAAIKSYDHMLQLRTQELVSCLSVRLGKEIDISEWLSYMALDFMGDFIFGGLFNFMEQGRDPTGLGKVAVKFARASEALGTIPWSNAILLALPKISFPIHVSAEEALQKRNQISLGNKDLFYYLLEGAHERGHTPLDDSTLVGEATLAVAAGSDTTGTALTNAIFHLHAQPEILLRLRKEVDSATLDDSGDFDLVRLAGLSYLNAIIQETLRLHPALPNGSQRTPPPDGGPVIVAGHIVPVGTVCQVPTWSIHRDPSLFYPFPESFWPERWLPEGPSLAKELGHEFHLFHEAFIPFSYGPGNCIGRAVALKELRLVLASLVRHFDFKFVDGFDTNEWLNSQEDHGILTREPLPVILTSRTIE